MGSTGVPTTSRGSDGAECSGARRGKVWLALDVPGQERMGMGSTGGPRQLGPSMEPTGADGKRSAWLGGDWLA
jgi:hypothetical protein